jgi:two-component system, cell cycle response regulator
MTGLCNGFAESDPPQEALGRGAGAGASPPDHRRRARQRATHRAGLVDLHESIATLLASDGQWRQAYHHLRSALDLLSASDEPQVPEQLRHEVDRLRREHAKAREQSMRDSLTASYNRRYLDERLVDLLTMATGQQGGQDNGLGVALVDLDWFKQVNDTYGHLLGDRVLQRVVHLLQEALPPGAFCARYGGEEFVLVLPATDAETAVAVCESARARIQEFAWSQLAPGLRVTVSMGLAHDPAAERESGADAATDAAERQLFSADVLLYAAKQAGRNAVAYRVADEIRLAGNAAGRRVVSSIRTSNY